MHKGKNSINIHWLTDICAGDKKSIYTRGWVEAELGNASGKYEYRRKLETRQRNMPLQWRERERNSPTFSLHSSILFLGDDIGREKRRGAMERGKKTFLFHLGTIT